MMPTTLVIWRMVFGVNDSYNNNVKGTVPPRFAKRQEHHVQRFPLRFIGLAQQLVLPSSRTTDTTNRPGVLILDRVANYWPV